MADRRVITGRHAKMYDRTRWALGPSYRAVSGELERSVPIGGMVLDIGTGPGQLLVETAERRRDLRVVGVDPSADMVTAARRRADAHHLQAPAQN